MNKLSLGKLSKSNASTLKLPRGISITTTQLLLIVVAIVLLILTIYFVISYFGATGEKKDLEHDIQVKQQQISAMGGPENISALQSQLEEAQKDLIEDSPFPQEINNTDVAYLIILAAREANITCFSYEPATDDTSTTINGHLYIENTFSIDSSGSESAGEKTVRIINFLRNLEELSYNTVNIKELTLSDSDGNGTWTVSFKLSIVSLH